MENLKSILTRDEKAVFGLRALYSGYGYSRYRMSKFEEYDLYARNKDYLVSDNIITFTDTDGRLLALKPDVTLSIIKNSRDKADGVIKAMYNENVYRISGGTHTFKEIMQVGLECIGDITKSEISEVLLLAKKSLDTISENNILEISHLDITYGVLGAIGVSDEGRTRIIEYLGRKDHDGVLSVCSDEGVSARGTELICKLVGIYGSPEDVIPKLDEFKVDEVTSAAIDELKDVTDALYEAGCLGGICIDFSLVGNMNYYNGIAFKGFIDGIPSGVLSGGQYDNLMRKMGRRSGAIGFAVYLDEIGLIPDTIAFPEVAK